MSGGINPFSQTMISEGVGDLIYIFTSGRNFTWKSYLKQKALSLAIAIATGGFIGARDSINLVQSNTT